MARSSSIDEDAGGIEMGSRLGRKDIEEGGDGTTTDNNADDAPDMGEWTRKSVRRQNRCMVIALGAFLISMAVYVLGGVDMFQNNSLVEKYEEESGTVENDFDNESDGDTNKKNGPWGSKGKGNPFGNKDRDKPVRGHFNKTLAREQAREKWNQRHPDVPFPKDRPRTRPGGAGASAGAGQQGTTIDWNKGFHPHPKKGDEDKGEDASSNNYKVPDPEKSKLFCENSLDQYKDWFKKKITKDDGVQYEIVEQLNHDPKAFTQGLTYANGVLYESAGLYGKSTVRILDPDTADVKKSVDMDPTLFAEGMAYINDELVQITWKSRRGFVYDPETLEIKREFKFSSTKNEGWGITLDECRNQIVMTDGSNNLHIWDPRTLQQIKTVPVMRQNNKPARELNEIEYWRDRILANVWYEDVLLVIHPETGKVEKEYDFSQLWPREVRAAAKADVFNGVSVSADPDVLYVTGKNWNRMFKIKLL